MFWFRNMLYHIFLKNNLYTVQYVSTHVSLYAFITASYYVVKKSLQAFRIMLYVSTSFILAQCVMMFQSMLDLVITCFKACFTICMFCYTFPIS